MALRVFVLLILLGVELLLLEGPLERRVEAQRVLEADFALRTLARFRLTSCRRLQRCREETAITYRYLRVSLLPIAASFRRRNSGVYRK